MCVGIYCQKLKEIIIIFKRKKTPWEHTVLRQQLCRYCAQVMRQAGRDEAAIARDRNTDREAVSFRINTGALSVAQEEILFFDVTPRDLAAV